MKVITTTTFSNSASLLLATMSLVGIAGTAQSQTLAPLQNPTTVYLNTPAPPDTVAAQQPDWDYFAWNSFVAMNWPALEAIPNQYRGVPNTSGQPGTTFATAPNDALAVWETFKEKREVFNHPATAKKLQWYSPVDYGDMRLASGVTVKTKTTMRTFHQNAGTAQAPDGLDETVEVQSESLEQTYPDGTTPNPVLKAIPPVVTPRVWRGQPSARNPIVYEVKVNYDYFNYVVPQGLNVNNSTTPNAVSTAAMAANIHLPFRSSSNMKSSDSAQTVPTLKYRAADAVTAYQTLNSIYQKSPTMNTVYPPGIGSVQIKAGWIKLGGSDAKPSDFPTWHTAFAQNYIDVGGEPVPSEPTLFGLVGLHIIQRIHTTDPAKPNATQGPGGTFVFSTWEHASIYNSPVLGQPNQPASTYFYSNYFNSAPLPEGVTPGFYPPLDQPAYPVVRQYPVLENTIAVTKAFHSAIADINPNSVWLNYHLVGTQFQAVDLQTPPPAGKTPYPESPNDPTGIGQPVFLANLGIETNLGLQFFKGQPPQITVIDQYQPELKTNGAIAFARDNANLAYQRSGYNMGGCMGCHGVAQSKGYSFSFVLLDGYLGAATDTQDHFDQPGANP